MNKDEAAMLAEMFDNQFDFNGKPVEVFARYGLPIRTIPNVTKKTIGRSSLFTYNNKEYKRVELVAKAFYESLGYTASWSEGFAIDLLETALTAEVCCKISQYFKVADSFLDNEVLNSVFDELPFKINRPIDIQFLLSNSDPKCFYSLQGAIRAIFEPSLRSANLVNIKEVESSKKQSDEYLELTITEEEIKLRIQEAIDLVIEEKNLERIESGMQMHLEYMQEKYNKGNLPQNINIWSLEFAKVVLNKVGFDRRFIRINIPRQFVCRGFDLTLIDENNEISFAEVKNEDKLTVFQNISIGSYLTSPIGKVELCLVEVESAT